MESKSQDKEKKKCEKLVYKNSSADTDPCVILGIILSEDDSFLIFKTARREYRISKSSIISIESTDIDFREEGAVQ